MGLDGPLDGDGPLVGRADGAGKVEHARPVERQPLRLLVRVAHGEKRGPPELGRVRGRSSSGNLRLVLVKQASLVRKSPVDNGTEAAITAAALLISRSRHENGARSRPHATRVTATRTGRSRRYGPSRSCGGAGITKRAGSGRLRQVENRIRPADRADAVLAVAADAHGAAVEVVVPEQVEQRIAQNDIQHQRMALRKRRLLLLLLLLLHLHLLLKMKLLLLLLLELLLININCYFFGELRKISCRVETCWSW